MAKSTLTARYQTIVPKEVREKLGLRADDELQWEVSGDHAEVKPSRSGRERKVPKLPPGAELSTAGIRIPPIEPKSFLTSSDSARDFWGQIAGRQPGYSGQGRSCTTYKFPIKLVRIQIRHRDPRPPCQQEELDPGQAADLCRSSRGNPP